MKKLLAFALAILLALGLCACDTGDPDNGGSESGNNNNQNTGSHASNHAFMPYLYGEWILQPNSYNENFIPPYQALTVNKDGTCTVDGQAATWEIKDDSRKNVLEILILVDGEAKYGAVLSMNSSGLANIMATGGEGMAYQSTLLNSTHYREIEITNENLFEYFELVAKDHWSIDEFGDFNSMSISYRLELKPQYRYYSYTTQSLSLELSYTVTSTGCTLDISNKTYTLGAAGEQKQHTEKRSLGYHPDSGCYFPVATGYYSSDPGTIGIVSHIQVLRSAGVLVLANDIA